MHFLCAILCSVQWVERPTWTELNCRHGKNVLTWHESDTIFHLAHHILHPFCAARWQSQCKVSFSDSKYLHCWWLHQLHECCSVLCPLTSSLVLKYYHELPDSSCGHVWNCLGKCQGSPSLLFCGILLGWLEHMALSQHSKAPAGRSWFKPQLNQGSTFISRCHYSPAGVWQMALWDIGFYGRSSFISNFFSHLMRSSRSSQIHFAVWILIGRCAPSFSYPLSFSLFFTDIYCKSLKT